MKENQKNNGKGIFYGVIGVATLVVAIIGATFAYFTATVSTNANNITGNMASINLALSVEKVTHVDDTSGLIPMSNSMIEAAVNKSGTNERGTQSVCVDDNGNAVCQIYSITISNNSTAAVFIDGYTALRNSTEGNAGTPTDIESATNKTTMRWAQVFPDSTNNPTSFTTGLSATGNGGSAYNLGGATAITWSSLDPTDKTEANAHNTGNIKTVYNDVIATNVLTIGGNPYDNINRNYIRISDHAWSTTTEQKENFDRNTDITSALVFNQRIAPRVDATTPTTVTYYIAVWLTETGTNQNTPGENTTTANTLQTDFFTGYVKINSSSGSEVSGTFQGLTAHA